MSAHAKIKTLNGTIAYEWVDYGSESGRTEQHLRREIREPLEDRIGHVNTFGHLFGWQFVVDPSSRIMGSYSDVAKLAGLSERRFRQRIKLYPNSYSPWVGEYGGLVVALTGPAKRHKYEVEQQYDDSRLSNLKGKKTPTAE